MNDVVLAMKKVLFNYASEYGFNECETSEEQFLGNILLGNTDIENVKYSSKIKKGSISMDNFWGNPRICIRSYEENGFEGKETLVSVSFDRNNANIHNIDAYNEKGIALALQLKKGIEFEINK